MAETATIHRVEMALSDVDRGVYESLDLRLAQHPSETMRYMVTRMLAYALSYEDGIAFSKGGLSNADQPPVAVHDAAGVFRAWIDVGAPSAERLHKASKAARRVAVFTGDLTHLRREAEARTIHRKDAIEVWPIASRFIDELTSRLKRHTKLSLTRNDGQLYVETSSDTLETPITRESL